MNRNATKNILFWTSGALLLIWGVFMLILLSRPQSILSSIILSLGCVASFMLVGAALSKRFNTDNSSDNDEVLSLDTSSNSSDKELLAADIAIDDFQSLGMDPMRDEDEIIFRYQGGYFRMSNIDHTMVRILYPRIYSVPVDKQNLLYRVLNRVNSSFPLVRLVATPVPEEEAIAVHGVADIMYTSGVSDRIDYLRQVLQLFFDTQHALAMGIAAAAVEPMEEAATQETMPQQLHDLGLN